MRIFLDANILVSVLNKEYPLFTYSARILSLVDHKRFTIYTSPVCLAIAFYFAEKKHGTAMAKKKMASLADHIQVTNVDRETVKLALADKKVHDFEDGIEYYSAKKSRCTVIITEDVNDYYFSEIEVLRSKDFMEKYLT